jgi:cytochrome c-type biogenesis protein CcmH/NrfF
MLNNQQQQQRNNNYINSLQCPVYSNDQTMSDEDDQDSDVSSSINDRILNGSCMANLFLSFALSLFT